MKTASILEAKTHFSALVRRVEGGERITITRDGEAVAELVPSSKAVRPFGIDDGKIRIAPDFDVPLPPDIARAFGSE
jgi:prevent-host-death family protein